MYICICPNLNYEHALVRNRTSILARYSPQACEIYLSYLSHPDMSKSSRNITSIPANLRSKKD